MSAMTDLNRARRLIDELAERTEQLLAEESTVRLDGDLTAEAKQTRLAALKAAFDTFRTELVAEVRQLLDQADSAANEVLAGRGDEALEVRKSRAQVRVSRLLDGGQSVSDTTSVFVEDGDLDALRSLRDEVPSWVAATSGAGLGGERLRRTRELLLMIDRSMAPLLSGGEAQAAEVRGAVDAERARLEATHVRSVSRSPMSLLRQAYASTEPPRRP